MEPFRMMPVARTITAIVVCLFFSCQNKNKVTEVDPAFGKYIEAYTSGVISRKNTITIRLAADASVTHTINETLKEKLFDFSPGVEGKAYWTDARTLEFKPDKALAADQMYTVSFQLGKVMHVPSAFGTFTFSVQTMKPSFQVDAYGLKANGKTSMTLSGAIITADVEASGDVEKLLSASLDNAPLSVSWQHNETQRTHEFVIRDIPRKTVAGSLVLRWNGAPLRSEVSGEKMVAVPAIGDFKVLDVRAIQEDEQYALVQFSDPVAAGQSFEGLIAVSGLGDLSYTVDGSEVKVYSASPLDGNYTINIHEGIMNEWDQKLKDAFTSNVFFENRLPSVKIQGRGTILPSGGGSLLLPFEATNLKAVDVSVVKIYENNIPQFLQENDMNGDEGLRRVGKPLVQATVALDEDKTLDLHRHNRFSLDLDKYIRPEPGAMYRVQLAFRPEYSLYTCTSSGDSNNGDNANDEGDDGGDYDYYYSSNSDVDEDEAFWRRYEDYYPYGYNWNQKDNPCSRSYYNREHFPSRNILSSDIGLTAKRSNDNRLFIAVTAITSTAPLKGVDLEVMDYQQQVIAEATSDADGIAMVDLKRKPYLLIAKRGDERGYLKLDDGNSLPLGRFDVSGADVQNGIKGVIFGERGVWRPGDSLFLSCVVDDRDDRLPEDHPVEMELISPRGQLYKRIIQPYAADGFNVFRTATDVDAPTGNWVCRVKIGNNVFEKKLKIETVMPNRLKIALDFGGQEALGKDAAVKGTLSAKWLFGATAQNLKARIDAQLYKRTTAFPRFADYAFDNPTVSFTGQSKTIFDGTLGADGTAVVSADFDAGQTAPGQLLANLLVKVFEPGGSFSIDNVAMPYNPYSSYVGVRVPEGDKTWGFLPAGKTQRFDIADVDTKGKLLSGVTRAEVSVYRIQWQWWWDNSDVVSNFTQDKYNKLVSHGAVDLQDGRGYYDIHMEPGDWGRYLILVKDTRSGHTAGKVFYVDDAGWQTRNDMSDPSAAAMLSFASDKEQYRIGEEVKLTIPSSEGGRALISIETGSKVLKTFWTPTTKGQTRFSFKTDRTMSPNVYVNVSLIQPHAQTINDLPIRMYGVIPLLVQDDNSFLKPLISMPSEIRPEQKTSVTVSEAKGRSMTYVIAVVDEGLLDLTRFKTPDPHEVFYAREALGVKSWDVFDEVIGAWGGQLERILTIGGDAEADIAAKTRRANRFKPVVQFLGPFRSNGGTRTHSFILPSYLGSVRVMVIAANDKEGAYGSAEKSVTVKKPLMMLATLPRVLAPEEEVKIPVTVFATNNNIGDVSLTLDANPFIEAAGSQRIHFSGSGEQQVYFSARVKSNTGIGRIRIVAASGHERAVSETEIDIRNPNPLVTQVSEYTLQPNQSWSKKVAMIGSGNDSRAVLEISSIPAINLEKRLNFLITYPHGCVEQTTSALFPQLVLNQLTELGDARRAQVDRNIRAGIQKLQNFQTSDGGFSYWPGETRSDEWGSNYAGHFLLEASQRGYNVSAAILQSWKVYEHNRAVSWNVKSAPWYGTDLVQAYRLYLLAMAGAPELGAMNRLREFKFITPEAKWRLAAAYQLIGQSKTALQMISGLPVTFPRRTDPGVTFGSDLRDQAMVLETLVVMKRKAEASELVKTIAARLADESWYSTQTTAYSLLAIARFCGESRDDRKIIVTGNAAGQSLNLSATVPVSQIPLKWSGGESAVDITNKGSNVLFVRVINEGQPVTTATAMPANDPGILRLAVSYLDMNGDVLDISSIPQGTDFVAKVTVMNPGRRGVYNQMALSEIFPGGWEILNTRLYNSEGKYQSSPSDYMDVRDDRVYYYFNIRPGQSLTYYVQLTAAYAGKYFYPGVYCEAMYDHSIAAGSAGKQVMVVP